MSRFEGIEDDSVQYHDVDGDFLEMSTGWKEGVVLETNSDGVLVLEEDIPEFIKHIIRLSDVDGDFVEASGHEVESLFEAYACGAGASRAVVTLGTAQAKAEIIEESARNLWAIAQVMRDEESRKAEKEALPEVGTYVTVRKGATTTYRFPVILAENTTAFVVHHPYGTDTVQVSGVAEGKRRIYSVHSDAVTVVRPKAVVGDRVTVAADARTYYDDPVNFGGQTVGTITEIHETDATVLGYCHTAKCFIEQQVALDFLTPAEEPKVGDRVFVHRDAKTSNGTGVFFKHGVEGEVIGRGTGAFAGDLYIRTEDTRVTVSLNRTQYVAPKWVAVLPPVVPEVGDRVLVPKDATTALGHPVFGTGKDIVAVVRSNVNSLGNIVVRTEDPTITPTLRQCVVDPKKVKVLEKAADIAAARAEVLKDGTAKFEDLPETLQKLVDAEIERKKK